MKTIKPLAAIAALFLLIVAASSWDYEIEQNELSDWHQVRADYDNQVSAEYRGPNITQTGE